MDFFDQARRAAEEIRMRSSYRPRAGPPRPGYRQGRSDPAGGTENAAAGHGSGRSSNRFSAAVAESPPRSGTSDTLRGRPGAHAAIEEARHEASRDLLADGETRGRCRRRGADRAVAPRSGARRTSSSWTASGDSSSGTPTGIGGPPRGSIRTSRRNDTGPRQGWRCGTMTRRSRCDGEVRRVGPGGRALQAGRSVARRGGRDALPVVDVDGRVVGVVSEADLILRDESFGVPGLPGWTRRSIREKLHASTARELMTAPAVTVSQKPISPKLPG